MEKVIVNDCPDRMKDILDESWKIFKWQFSNETFNVKIENEANFQFYFAMIIKNIGEMFTKGNEHFFVDVETKWGDAQNNRNKLIDITCGFNVEDRETKEPQILNINKAYGIKRDEAERRDGKARWYFLEIAVTR